MDNTSNKDRIFYNKKMALTGFIESSDTVNPMITFVSGTNNDLKRDFVDSMTVQSCSTNPTVFLDTRGYMADNSLNRISTHPFVHGDVKKIDIYKDGLPVNLKAMDSDKSKEENLVNLFDLVSSVCSSPKKKDMKLLKEVLYAYLEEKEALTECSPIKASLMEDRMLSIPLISTEIYTSNNPAQRELLYSVEKDLDECKVMFESWEDIINSKASLSYVSMNSGSRDSAIPIANMLLASLRNHRKRTHDIPINLIINDISDLNFSWTGAIRKIIDECDRLNINVIGISADYHPSSSPVGKVISSAAKQYFLSPTPSSKNLVDFALRIKCEKAWQLMKMSIYEPANKVILKELAEDKYMGPRIATVYSGDYRNMFSLDEYIQR